MIPLLLWRCPLCATNDALRHLERWFRPDLVRCCCCGAEWRVRRAPGDQFYLRLVKNGAGDELDLRDERTIAAWYDAMKQTVRLEPVDDPANALAASLEPGEVLYLTSSRAELQAEENDPLFFAIHVLPQAARMDKRKIKGQQVGCGRLFLTNRRLIWQGNGAQHAFALNRVNSAYAFLNYGLSLLIETRLYMVHFLAESPLKWVMYMALVARQVQTETGHQITTSHF